MPFNNNIGTIIRNARKSKKYTQEHLSQITGISIKTIGEIENGKRNPRFDTFETLAKALNIPSSLLSNDLHQGLSPDAELFVEEFKAANPLIQMLVMISGRAIMNGLNNIPIDFTS